MSTKSRFARSVPVLPVLDVEKATKYYEETLGFRTVFLSEEPYAIVVRDDVEIHLWQCDDPELPARTGCRIIVEGIDDLYAELEPRGVVHPNAPLETKQWGSKEFAIGDLDRNLITFEENSKDDKD